MSLSDLASLGSLVSGGAVLLSLVYLALQVRQAEKNQQAQITQTRTTRSIDILMQYSEPGLAEAILRARKGAEDLTETEHIQFTSYMLALFSHWEDSYFQHADRLMTHRAFRTAVNLMRATLANPATRVAWRRVNAAYEPDFRQFIDGLTDEDRARPYNMGFDQWKAEYDAELPDAPGSSA